MLITMVATLGGCLLMIPTPPPMLTSTEATPVAKGKFEAGGSFNAAPAWLSASSEGIGGLSPGLPVLGPTVQGDLSWGIAEGLDVGLTVGPDDSGGYSGLRVGQRLWEGGAFRLDVLGGSALNWQIGTYEGNDYAYLTLAPYAGARGIWKPTHRVSVPIVLRYAHAMVVPLYGITDPAPQRGWWDLAPGVEVRFTDALSVGLTTGVVCAGYPTPHLWCELRVSGGVALAFPVGEQARMGRSAPDRVSR